MILCIMDPNPGLFKTTLYLSTPLIAAMTSPCRSAMTRSTKTESGNDELPGCFDKVETLVLIKGCTFGGVTRTISSARSWGILLPEIQ